MKMLANNILVRPESWAERKLGKIIVPSGTEEKFARGEVLAVGTGLYLANGDRPPVEAQVGDHVLYFKASADDIVVGGVNSHLVQERQIIAILEPGDFDNEERNN